MSDNNKLTRIEDKIDKIEENVSSINITLAAQHESLKIHIKRTDLLEQKLERSDKYVTMAIGSIRFLGFLAAIATAAEVIIRIKNV